MHDKCTRNSNLHDCRNQKYRIFIQLPYQWKARKIIISRFMADKELIDDFLQSEGLLYQLAETIQEEIRNDDEPFDKVARNLLITYSEHPEVVDEVMMSLCGWTMESLMKMV